MPEIADLKNVHKGERCFVFGTGPSVNDCNLEKILDEPIFAVNKFYMHPLWEKFKKVYYVDISGVSWLGGTYNQWKLEKVLKNKNALYFFQNTHRSLHELYNIFPEDKRYYINLFQRKKVFNGDYIWDLTIGSAFANTGVIEGAMAIAQWMGFKDIYILGCDSTSYFDENNKLKDDLYFFDWKLLPEQYWTPPTKDNLTDSDRMVNSWKNLYRLFKEKGINIYNLAKKSEGISFIPRVNFDEL